MTLDTSLGTDPATGSDRAAGSTQAGRGAPPPPPPPPGVGPPSGSQTGGSAWRSPSSPDPP
jgi:hypothetical protein